MSPAAAIQPFKQLDADTDDALRASIKRFGVVVPIVVDNKGRIIDGHNRARIAKELSVQCPQVKRVVRDDEHANELAYSLNADRRQMSVEQRREVVAELRGQGFSFRAIADVVGVDPATVHRDVKRSGVAPATPPPNMDPETGEVMSAGAPVLAGAGVPAPDDPAPRTKGRDGKSYAPEAPAPSPELVAAAERLKLRRRFNKAMDAVHDGLMLFTVDHIRSFADPDAIESIDSVVARMRRWCESYDAEFHPSNGKPNLKVAK